ncbi:glycosyltransferase family 4 protein [Ferruginibacter lapsinanis]|uniref:glycosyltransferase family 4 protein n=1 Tax=Ferruginibacter lapsinanis TaxID=563172 RepID=UPI001E3C6B17|nr:glycosyltransferase family 1 protein [Ferruginibacter lapsinanis]UEG50562.1 glycosyltransferase family 4 protein [Ferruginibacter lapsinanis]
MKVLFDHQTFNYQKYGGISRYFAEVIDGLRQNKNLEVELPLVYSHNAHLAEKKMNPTKPYLEKNFKGNHRIQNLISKYHRIKVQKKLKKGVDIFHPTYYDTYYLNSLGKAKLVLTIYDMIHERKLFSEKINSNTVLSDNKKKLAQQASGIIAISESTKKDIIELYGISEEKIHVIYLSSSLLPVNDYKPSISIPREYILFVGNRDHYKNFTFFLQAISPLLLANKNLYLICAGGGKFSEVEKLMINELQLNDQILQIGIDDKILSYLYQNAKCFVFPSLYEGFGIPTLEAFACGCPVVLSNSSSMPEVGGDAALYIDPNDRASIYSTVKRLIEDKSLQQSLKEKGFQQAKKFSWGKCIEEHFKLYTNLLQ